MHHALSEATDRRHAWLSNFGKCVDVVKIFYMTNQKWPSFGSSRCEFSPFVSGAQVFHGKTFVLLTLWPQAPVDSTSLTLS